MLKNNEFNVRLIIQKKLFHWINSELGRNDIKLFFFKFQTVMMLL